MKVKYPFSNIGTVKEKDGRLTGQSNRLLNFGTIFMH